jgi:hypothetical protein
MIPPKNRHDNQYQLDVRPYSVPIPWDVEYSLGR